MSRLRRVRGHFFNWYDTQDLRPLEPMYVSTVDSGNLAGHLIAVAQACRERAQRPVFGPEVLEGIGDALDLLADGAMEESRVIRARADGHGGAAARGRGDAAIAPARGDLPASLAGLGAPARASSQSGRTNLLDIARTLASEIDDDAGSESPRSGRGRARLRREPRARPRAAAAPEASDRAQRLPRASPRRARAPPRMVQAMDFQFLFDPSQQALLDRLSRGRRHARSQLLRPAGFRGPPGELSGHRQGRRVAPALVPSRTIAHADRRAARPSSRGPGRCSST